MRLALLVLAGSGGALALGLLMLYLPALRHPLVWLLLGCALAAAAGMWPQAAVVAAQSAALGLLLVALAALLKRVSWRRQLPAPLPRKSASSILNRGSTQTQFTCGPPRRGIRRPRPRWRKRPDRNRSHEDRWQVRLPLIGRRAAAGCRREAGAQGAQPGRPAEHELKFRRIYAPSNGILDWPRGNVRYLPVEPEEFERLMQAASGLPIETATALSARFDRARYSARLDDDLLTAGQAILEIVHSAAGAVLLPLSPCNLALSQETRPDEPQDVVLGLRPDGRLAALVKQSGSLRLGWTLRGRRDATGAVEFEIELPRSADNRFELDLPAQTMPIASAGLVSSLGGGQGERARWVVELGGQHQFHLRVAPNDPASERRRLALLRTAPATSSRRAASTSSRSGSSTSQHDSLHQLEVALDPGLQLVSALYGETPVAWSALRGVKDGASRLVLELPDAVRGPSRVLRLAAMAPLRLDESTLLPRMQPHGVTWQEGTLSLLLPEPFQLQQLLTFSCRQSKTGPLPASLPGEALELQCFGPEATAQVLVARQRDPLRISSAVDVSLASGEKTARWTANLEVAGGERFNVLADVPRHWVIESLATIPEDDLADWGLVDAEGSDRLLSVRLAKAITPNHPVRLVIAAAPARRRWFRASVPAI